MFTPVHGERVVWHNDFALSSVSYRIYFGVDIHQLRISDCHACLFTLHIYIFFYSTCTVYNNNSFGASSCLTGVSKNPCNFPSSFILNMVSIISLSSSGNSLCNSLYASSSIFIRIHIFLLSSPIENLLKHWSVTFRSQPFVLVHKRLFFLTPI